MHFSYEQFAGCLIGLATGDALGAPYEGGIVERLLWRLIGRTSDGLARWTDDTQMALDLAASLLDCDGLVEDDLAARFATSYSWRRGYGPSTAKVLRRIRNGQSWQAAATAIYPQGSYGNGAAMRSPVIALFCANDFDDLMRITTASARVTHAHSHGIEGAVLIAVATHALLHGKTPAEVLSMVQANCHSPEFQGRLHAVNSWLTDNVLPTPEEVVGVLGNGMTAMTSCVTALYIGLRHLHRPFHEMMQFTIACRGDVDTIGAMAGALWGVSNGASKVTVAAIEARGLLEATASRLLVHANAVTAQLPAAE